jgi:hypothetical protein
MPRLKPTKSLALYAANMLDLGALAPGEELEWRDVREVTNSVTDEKLDHFQLELLTDWVHKIAVKRLSWRRGRPAI